MLNRDCLAWGQSENIIRDLTAYALVRKGEIGADKVFDFSIGNPSVPTPPELTAALRELLEGDPVALHSYTPAAGFMSLRQAIADDLNARYPGVNVQGSGVYVTCGASAGLAICMRALLQPGEKVLAFAPFFPEYPVFAEAAGGELVTIPPAAGLQPDLDALAAALDERTAAVIVNTPNNPSGVVLSDESLTRLCGLLREAERRFGRTIYLVSDEPYRELVYDGEPVPGPIAYYDDTVLCYSFSKS
ncbi:MAG: aminotransferase class I/II-fold pyridoxal phosphate-dependent enzyme, partial [Oscillospiraceae bacterium]|nr:aminotransferase class I/II-fold pyridoxal phosphate-dependent enzyme [Oscillospiraceae bacterium]